MLARRARKYHFGCDWVVLHATLQEWVIDGKSAELASLLLCLTGCVLFGTARCIVER
jgi:hypothetical protein